MAKQGSKRKAAPGAVATNRQGGIRDAGLDQLEAELGHQHV